MLEAYKKEDPKASPKLAVPVGLPRFMVRQARKRRGLHKAKHEAIADLCNSGFYYLLRVGEYTKQPPGKQTKPLDVSEITFRDAHHNIIPNESSAAQLDQAVEATLRIGNQKTGIKGETIHADCTGRSTSPVKSLARRVHHILSHGGAPHDASIYTYFLANGVQRYIDPNDINTALKESAKDFGLFKLGYERGDVSSHSLRAGGAMAMHLNGCSDLKIRKQGRWRSDTFLMYIHEQISAFSTGVSLKMSQDIKFRPIAGPKVRRTAAAA